MAKTRFVAVGDLHLEKLDRVLTGLDHIGLQLQCLHDAASWAQDHDVSRLILLGDIFETPYPDQVTVRRFLETLHRYPQLEFHLIRGNHDFDNIRANSLELLEFITGIKALPNVELYLNPTKATWDGVPMCFLSYPYLKPVKRKKPQIVLAHQELAGAIRDNGMKIPKAKGQPKIDPKDYWIIGHLHRHQKGRRYIYAGTMCQMNFGEPPDKGFLDIRASYNGQLVVKAKYLKYRPPFKLINLQVSSEADLEQIKARSTRRYKVVLAEDAELPLDWRNRFPNVVNVVGTKNQQQAEQELSGELAINEELTDEVDITRNLSPYLKARGFRSEARKRGKRKVEGILARIK